MAAVAVFVASHAPAQTLSLADPAPDGTIPGVIHVHTIRSDGRGTPDEIAAAAARAGLKFIVFTDTATGPTRRIRRCTVPACCASMPWKSARAVDTTSRSTCPRRRTRSAGKRATSSRTSIGSAASASRRIRIRRKTELRWREWTAPIDGIEMVNPDTSWRQCRRWRRLAQRAQAPRTRCLDYPIRPAETIASLVRPERRSRNSGRPRAKRRRGRRSLARTRTPRSAADNAIPATARVAAAPQLRSVVPDAVGPRPAGPCADRRRGGDAAHDRARDSRRACLYRDRRRWPRRRRSNSQRPTSTAPRTRATNSQPAGP